MFKIDGVSNIEIGAIPLEENFLSRAAVRYEEILIDGKNEPVINTLGYSSVVGQLQLQLTKKNLDLVYKLFTGKRRLEFQERITFIEFFDFIDIKREGRHKTLTINYRRYPFWSKIHDEYVLVKDTVFNDGNIYSKPIIKLVGTANSDVNITIAGIRFVYHFDEDNEVIIDCDSQEETFNGISKSKNIEIGFEYPILKVGANKVKTNSGNCEIYFKRKDAWL